jgi:dethiobiotin synthetase
VSDGVGAARIYFVTGTDTGVGKTVAAAGLARALARLGRRVVAIKLVETGCGEAVDPSEDGHALAAAAGQDEPGAALLRLRTPVTPALAADLESRRIDFDALVERTLELAAGADVAIVEGAGGLYAPITWERNPLDAVRALGASVVVVAADRLGTINHTLLTLKALEGVQVAALVLSAPPSPDESTGTNAEAVVRHANEQGIAVPRVVALPRVADADEAADALESLARQMVVE